MRPTFVFAQLTKCAVPCVIEPDVNTLPNKQEKLGFRRLLYDRQRAFMTMELVRIRDALIGNDALVAKAKINPNPDMLSNVVAAQLFSADSPTNPHFGTASDIFRSLICYVSDAAYADAALHWTGHLPPVPTFAKAQALLACNCEGIDYDQGAIINTIKSKHQPDWKGFLAYMESQRANGRIAAKSAMDLRLRLQRALKQLNEDFLEAAEQHLCHLGFPYQEIGMLDGEAEVRKLVEKVEKLPQEISKALATGYPFSYSVAHLEELRKRGKVVRESIVRLRRQEGEALFARAAKLSGAQAETLMDEAEIKFFSVMQSPGFDSGEAHIKLTELYMAQKKYKLVDAMLAHTLRRCGAISEEAKDYANSRWSSIVGLRTGETQWSSNERGNLTEAQDRDAYKLLWQVLIYKAKSHVELCKEALKGDGVMTEENVKIARDQRDEARSAFRLAKQTKYAPPTSEAELVKLDDTYRERIAAHNQAVKAARGSRTFCSPS